MRTTILSHIIYILVLTCHSILTYVIITTTPFVIGDHPLTAEAIARQVHIVKGKTKVEVAAERGCDESDIQPDEYDAVVLHGETLLTMDEDEWAEVYTI
jgi:magnesium-transporting ATPase (P-type)